MNSALGLYSLKLFLVSLELETFWSCPDDGKSKTEMSLYGSVYIKTSLPIALVKKWTGKREAGVKGN